MSKIIRLTESDLNRIVKKVLKTQQLMMEDNPKPQPGRGGGYNSTISGTNTKSSGAYVTPAGINFTNNIPGGIKDRTYTEQPSLRYGGYDDDNPDPYDRDKPRKLPTPGQYVGKLSRSPMCCKKCKNGRFKHQCDDTQASKGAKYDSTNCVYATISDCQLNKRSKPGTIKGVKKKK